jgi:hypothetical protein
MAGEMSNPTSFCGLLAASEQLNVGWLAYILEQELGSISATRATTEEDMAGTDYWALLPSGKKLSIDVKLRSTDYAVHSDPTRRADDLCLEVQSVVEKGKIGWTLDDSKETDYVLWLWPSSGRHCLMPFPWLRQAFYRHIGEWTELYSPQEQETASNGSIYHSRSLFVPRSVVWAACLERDDGRPLPRHATEQARRKVDDTAALMLAWNRAA